EPSILLLHKWLAQLDRIPRLRSNELLTLEALNLNFPPHAPVDSPLSFGNLTTPVSLTYLLILACSISLPLPSRLPRHAPVPSNKNEKNKIRILVTRKDSSRLRRTLKTMVKNTRKFSRRRRRSFLRKRRTRRTTSDRGSVLKDHGNKRRQRTRPSKSKMTRMKVTTNRPPSGPKSVSQNQVLPPSTFLIHRC
ncbi:hypothetical protein B0H11DRAFT_1313080, partial [Mycena galericulata]